MTTRVAIHQPGYYRSLSYFAKRISCDVFVSMNDVQFNRQDWQHRQRFLIEGRRIWMSVPVDRGKANLSHKRIADPSALRKHWLTISRTYARARYFKTYAEELAEIYSKEYLTLQPLCDRLTAFACDRLGVTTLTLNSSDIPHDPDARKGQLLAQLARGAADLNGADPGEDIEYVACPNEIRVDHYLNSGSSHDRAVPERAWLERSGVWPVTYPYILCDYPRSGQAPWPQDIDAPAIDLVLHNGPGSRSLLDRMMGVDA
jgi:WbqC-like protein family